jgi:RimJ/RimL family protein N-acetyltransferase
MATPTEAVHIDCGAYLIRTVTLEDASERVGNWMADQKTAVMLNAPRKAWSKRELESYIKTFDQQSRMLLGIFDKASGLLLGFLTIVLDRPNSRAVVNIMIGEPDYRNKGVTQDITPPFRDWFFDTLGLKTMLATALAYNRPIIHYLLKTGWTLDKTIPRRVKSRTDGSMIDLCYFSQTREAWHAWKKANLPAPDVTGEAKP